MTVRELAPQHPEHEQKTEQHNNSGNNGDHAFRNIAADVWKPGITAKEESGNAKEELHKTESIGAPKEKAGKETPKEANAIKIEHETEEALKKTHEKEHDVDAKFEKSAEHGEHGHHGDKHVLKKVSAGGEAIKPLGGDVVEKFTGTDGKMHTYTPLNIEKFMPKQFEDLQKV